MTPEQIEYYLSVCQREDPDMVATCYDIYKDPMYHTGFQLAAAEIGYWYEHHRIEPYFMCLQSVIEMDEGLIFVHKDPAQLQ